MFKKVTQSIVDQMDPGGDLVPVPSILDHEHFQPLCLVRRKRKTMFKTAPGYKRTWYRLEDVLLPEAGDKSPGCPLPSGATQAAQHFMLQRSSRDRADGSLNISLDPARLEIKGAASSSSGWTIKLQKKQIPVPQIEAVKAERKVNMEHSFIQQLQRAGQDLYLVHESIETLEDANYQESTKADGSLMAQLYAKFHAEGARESIQSITIPKGCTLAFRALQLAISDGPWGLEYFSARSRSAFVSDSTAGHRSLQFFCGTSMGAFQELKTEVQRSCGVLHLRLPPDLPARLLKAIRAAMGDRNLFEELSHAMDAVLDGAESCELQTASPDLEELLSSLEDFPERSRLAEAITYTLDALEELTEDQLLLLLESLDKKMVSQQLQMVSGILAQEEIGRPFKVATFLLPFPQEEQALMRAMVERSGLALGGDGSASWPREAFPALAALYASLHVLALLSSLEQAVGCQKGNH